MKKILVIEDNPHNLKMISLILIKSGFEVIQATYAEKGIILAEECQPDLILMDIQLPDMNGIEAAKILKSNEITSHIKIMAISAFTPHGATVSMMDCYCEGYIAKPIRYKDFLNIVQTTLDNGD